MDEERLIGLDFFRILCCIGVLCFHIFDDVLMFEGGGARILYFSFGFCVTGFFLLSGFLIGEKGIIEFEYYEKKIFGILKKVLGWIIVYALIHYVLYGEFINIWINYANAFIGQGVNPVCWFLLVYIVLLIVSPIIIKVIHKCPRVIFVVMLFWIIMLNTSFLDNLRNIYPMCLWFHVYACYFIIGIFISNFEVNTISRKYIIASVVVFVICSFIYGYKVITSKVFYNPEAYYGRTYYLLWVVNLFILCKNLSVKNYILRYIIEKMSKNTWAVYLGHLPLLLFITSIKPISSTTNGVAMVLALFFIFQIISEIFKQLPVLRKIV